MTESREPAPSEPDNERTGDPLLPTADPKLTPSSGDVGETPPGRDPDPDDGSDTLV